MILADGSVSYPRSQPSLAERLKIVAEPSGAVPLAALLSGAAGRIAVVLSGGDIAPADFAATVTG